MTPMVPIKQRDNFTGSLVSQSCHFGKLGSLTLRKDFAGFLLHLRLPIHVATLLFLDGLEHLEHAVLLPRHNAEVLGL